MEPGAWEEARLSIGSPWTGYPLINPAGYLLPRSRESSSWPELTAIQTATCVRRATLCGRVLCRVAPLPMSQLRRRKVPVKRDAELADETAEPLRLVGLVVLWDLAAKTLLVSAGRFGINSQCLTARSMVRVDTPNVAAKVR